MTRRLSSLTWPQKTNLDQERKITHKRLFEDGQKEPSTVTGYPDSATCIRHGVLGLFLHIKLNHETSNDETLSQREGTKNRLSIIQRVRNLIVFLVHVLIFVILISYLLVQRPQNNGDPLSRNGYGTRFPKFRGLFTLTSYNFCISAPLLKLEFSAPRSVFSGFHSPKQWGF